MNSIVATKSAIAVEQKGDTLAVDSRLIAEQLGIEHESFMRTIKKYESKIEQRFSLIRFEILAVKIEGQRGTKYREFAWLTEDQALFLMTLSRNTDQVVECKANLVEAFAKARQVIPAQSERIRELELMNENLKLQNELSKRVDTMASFHGVPITLALLGRGDCIVKQETLVTEIVEPETGNVTKILTADQLKKAVKDRTGQKLPTMKVFTDALRKAGRDDLLVPVTRSQTSEYPIPEKLDEAIAVVYGKQRQRLIGE